MTVLCKRGAPFKPNTIFLFLSQYFDLLIQAAITKTAAFACNMQLNKRQRKIIKTYVLQCLFKYHNKYLQFKIYYHSNITSLP